MKNALIFGISGQDGAYLAKLLLEKGYTVFGASRDADIASFSKLIVLDIRKEIYTIFANPADFRSVLSALKKNRAVQGQRLMENTLSTVARNKVAFI